MVRFFIFNFLRMGSVESTPDAFRRDFNCVVSTTDPINSEGRRRRHGCLKTLASKSVAPITGLHFYKQFACQMPGHRARNASAFFSYILYLIVPQQRTPPGGNFGGN